MQCKVQPFSTKISHYSILNDCIEKCGVTHDFQQCDILTSVDSDEPVKPPFKLSNSK